MLRCTPPPIGISDIVFQFSASIPGIFYALLGSSRQLNVAPEAALSLLLGQAVSEIRRDYPDAHGNLGDAVGLSVATIVTLQVYLPFLFSLMYLI